MAGRGFFFTEEEIRQELVDMGLVPTPKLIADLRKSIAEMEGESPPEDETAASHQSSLDFSMLELAEQPVQEPISAAHPEFASPLRFRERRGLREQRQHVPPLAAFDQLSFTDPESDRLMATAYSRIDRIYQLCDEFEQEISEIKNMSSEELLQRARLRSQLLEAECVERREQSADSGQGSSQSVATQDTEDAVQMGVRPRLMLPLKELGVHPVQCPPPGRRPFRFDPVNKIAIYKKEWQRLPPPGENRRLSLRWKIRDQLMRREIPRFDIAAAHMEVPPLVHPKEWSPRPYLE